MHDDPKPSMAVLQTASSAQMLRCIADALGVPVSSFDGVDADTRLRDVPAASEEAALLATIQSYLRRANPAARDRFVAAVQTMVKLPST